MTEKVGILHPGAMGVSVAAAARNSGCEVFWVADGRGPQTRERAQAQSLRDAGSLEALCATCSIIIGVCPPHAAEAMAAQIAAQSFKGIYADVNAISPQRTQQIAAAMGEHGIAFVDGGIIGPPAWKPGTTWLSLCGPDAQRVADCFTAGPLQAEVIGDEIGAASALKMCYAAYTKGSTALLCASLATAARLGVRERLQQQWARDGSGLDARAPRLISEASVKGWRFVGEMDEIAATFAQAGLPAGFHQAAADLYRQLSAFRGRAQPPTLDEVLDALDAQRRPDGGA
ncbi:MAG: DUF1932 domain-containing protein [Burkholderiaceae bacterium]